MARDAFFEIDRLRGELSYPLKDRLEIDSDAVLSFFSQLKVSEGCEDWMLVEITADWVWLTKTRKYMLYGF